jgi:hypothetical protein
MPLGRRAAGGIGKVKDITRRPHRLGLRLSRRIAQSIFGMVGVVCFQWICQHRAQHKDGALAEKSPDRFEAGAHMVGA